MNDKSVTSFGDTTVTQTAHEIDLKVGPDIKIPQADLEALKSLRGALSVILKGAKEFTTEQWNS